LGVEAQTDGYSRYAHWLATHAGRVVLAPALVAAGAIALCTSLQLGDDIAELLPAGTKSVEDLRRISSKVGGGNLTIAIQSPDLKTNERFAEDLVARLRARMAGDIRFLDYNVRALVDFYEHNA